MNGFETQQNNRFSTNNPFRMDLNNNNENSNSSHNTWASFESNYSNDNYDQYNFIDDNANFESRNVINNNNHNNNKHAFNASPTVSKRSSTNPFLDDMEIEEQQRQQQQNILQPLQPRQRNQQTETQQNAVHYPNSREEKEQLRRRFHDENNAVSNDSIHRNRLTPPQLMSADLPPSYDEVSDKRIPKNVYPDEKHSQQQQQPRRSNTQSGRTPSQSRRVHRHHSTNEHHDRSHHRYHSASSTSSNPVRESRSSKSKKDKRKSAAVISKNVDTIDKLDVTGLFGGSFHHDGPFDACTPHRNKGNKAAPVMAFPADGPNSTLTGPANKKSTMNEVFGVDDIDDDSDLYTRKPSTKDAIRSNASNNLRNIDAKTKTVQVHGTETSGLGSSTFLDGAPAVGYPVRNGGGLQRGNTISYRSPNSGSYNGYNTNASNNNNAGLRRNLSTNSRPPLDRYNSTGSSYNNGRVVSRGELNYGRTHSAGVSEDDLRRNSDRDEDVYLGGVHFDSTTKKSSSTGSKLLRRVKSLKVGSRKN